MRLNLEGASSEPVENGVLSNIECYLYAHKFKSRNTSSFFPPVHDILSVLPLDVLFERFVHRPFLSVF